MQAIKTVFRQADLLDVPAIMKIRLAVRENVLADPAQVTPQVVADYLRARGRGWVCEVDREIVGFSIADRQDALIWALFVLPEYEGIGAGQKLLKLAVDWLFKQGKHKVRLATEAGTRADRFYQSQGWQRGKMKDAVEVWYSFSK